MVADFLTSGAEAVAHEAESCQFGFVNRQLCRSSEEYRGAYRQHRFLFFLTSGFLRFRSCAVPITGVLMIRIKIIGTENKIIGVCDPLFALRTDTH